MNRKSHSTKSRKIATQSPDNQHDAQQQKPHNVTSRKELMLKCLERSLGVVTIAARNAGIDRKVHYDWMRNDPDYAIAVSELREVVLDYAENKLHALITDGDTAATIFLLKTLGKSRGFIERQEIELQKGIDITWNEVRTYDTIDAQDIEWEQVKKDHE